MGIRFYCPNGHRLHVKSFQAGKRGICPHCDARFRIPRESEIPKGSPKIRPTSEGIARDGPVARPGEQPAVAVSAEQPTAPEVDSVPVTLATDANIDPIDESPDALWYVRPPSGGQYGPANGEVLRKWISEERVTADTLIWRDGWTEWQAAGPLFPLSAPTEGIVADEPQVEIQLEPEEVALSQRSSVDRRRSSSSRHRSVALVVTLVLLTMILVVALVYVIQSTQ
jgi:hypothetical protein